MDIEGAEYLFFQAIDFQIVYIHVMMIEIRNYYCKKQCEVRELVRERWRKKDIKDTRDWSMVEASDIYVHSNSIFQVKGVQPATA